MRQKMCRQAPSLSVMRRAFSLNEFLISIQILEIASKRNTLLIESPGGGLGSDRGGFICLNVNIVAVTSEL